MLLWLVHVGLKLADGLVFIDQELVVLENWGWVYIKIIGECQRLDDVQIKLIWPICFILLLLDLQIWVIAFLNLGSWMVGRVVWILTAGLLAELLSTIVRLERHASVRRSWKQVFLPQAWTLIQVCRCVAFAGPF